MKNLPVYGWIKMSFGTKVDFEKKSNKDRDWEIFRKLRKKSQSSLKQAHWDYLNNLFLEDDNNNKRLWRYLKGTRKDSCCVSTLVADGKIGTDPSTKAEMLNRQFSSVFTRENQSTPYIMNQSPYPEMPAIHVSNGVFKLLNQLNQHKANGPDNIPAVFLKLCASELAKMLTFIIQQSLGKQTLP